MCLSDFIDFSKISCLICLNTLNFVHLVILDTFMAVFDCTNGSYFHFLARGCKEENANAFTN